MEEIIQNRFFCFPKDMALSNDFCSYLFMVMRPKLYICMLQLGEFLMYRLNEIDNWHSDSSFGKLGISSGLCVSVINQKVKGRELTWWRIGVLLCNLKIGLVIEGLRKHSEYSGTLPWSSRRIFGCRDICSSTG